MAQDLPVTKRVLEDVSAHLTQTGCFNTQIEVYLARSIAVALCAEIELAVTTLVGKRLDKTMDAESASYTRAVTKNVVRNARSGEIGDVMAKFGPACKTRYDQAIDAALGPAGKGIISNLVTSRDQFSHLQPPPMTFREVATAYVAAVAVISAVEVALGEAYP